MSKIERASAWFGRCSGACSRLTGLFEAAFASAGQFIAMCLDAHAAQPGLKPEAAGNAIVQQRDVLVLKLHHTVAIQADQVIVLRFVEEVRIVVGLVAAEVHLAQHAALCHEADGAVNRRAGHRAVDFAHLVEQFLRVEMIVGGKRRLHDHIALLGAALALLGHVGIQALFDSFIHAGKGGDVSGGQAGASRFASPCLDRSPALAKGTARMSALDTREIILEARELTREFDGVKALDRFSFQLHRGEVLGLLGANGAGKTTAMNCLLGLTLPTGGDLFAFGLPLHQHRIKILQRCNFSSAYTALPGNLLVGQNLLVFAKIYGVRDPKKKIAELMELLEISHLSKRVTGQLSAGESTRVNLVKAFLNDPELLMLDEPTASLDPDIADKVRKVVRKVQKDRDIGILYTSHNMRDIEEVCDRVIFLHKGKIVCEGTPHEIVTRSSSATLEDVFIKIARDGEIIDEPEKEAKP